MGTANRKHIMVAAVLLAPIGLLPLAAAADRDILYDLKGPGGVRVTYTTSSILGVPQLRYADGKTDRTFSGSEIRSASTELGTLLTVTLRAVPDGDKLIFTLLVPVIVFEGAELRIETSGIWTTDRTSVFGFPKGQLQSYDTVRLTGTAHEVVF